MICISLFPTPNSILQAAERSHLVSLLALSMLDSKISLRSSTTRFRIFSSVIPFLLEGHRRLGFVFDFTGVKVLIAAGTSAVIGQVSKPFTSVVLYGKKLDFRSVFQAGGFPSTHSSVSFSLFLFSSDNGVCLFL